MKVAASIGIPNFGTAPDDVGLDAMAQAVEAAGFDGVWVADHVMIPHTIRSAYPYSSDGSFFLPGASQFLEALTTLAFLAGCTERVRLGIGVCVVPMREPRLLAAQVATVDRLSGGRAALGVGSGWLEEEFAAVEVPFEGRGDRLNAAIDLMRACWTGHPAPGHYGPFSLPLEVGSLRPAGHVPVLVGGFSNRALRRAVERGDGWYGCEGTEPLPTAKLERVRAALVGWCERLGRDPLTFPMALRLQGSRRDLTSGRLADRLSEFVAAGVSSFTFDIRWSSPDEGRATLESLRVVLPDREPV